MARPAQWCGAAFRTGVRVAVFKLGSAPRATVFSNLQILFLWGAVRRTLSRYLRATVSRFGYLTTRMPERARLRLRGGLIKDFLRLERGICEKQIDEKITTRGTKIRTLDRSQICRRRRTK